MNINTMDTKKITVILSYYNQPKETLLRHIHHWKQLDTKTKNIFCFYIIDDGSKFPASKILENEDLEDIDLHLYRVEQDLYCNIAGVRNLGASECKTPYMIILDMDTVMDYNMANQLTYLADTNKNKNNVFKFNRHVPDNVYHIKHNQPHPAVCLIRKEDYWNIGGCEEDLVGNYGQTDPIFWYRAQGVVNVYVKKEINLLYYPDAEADINRDTAHNTKLFESKKKTNDWSNDFVRFKWVKIM